MNVLISDELIDRNHITKRLRIGKVRQEIEESLEVCGEGSIH
jgi:hypothetical protein